jgi:hypothetical protein
MWEFADKHKRIIDLFILRDRGCLDLMRRHIEDAKTLTLGVLGEIDRGAF